MKSHPGRAVTHRSTLSECGPKSLARGQPGNKVTVLAHSEPHARPSGVLPLCALGPSGMPGFFLKINLIYFLPGSLLGRFFFSFKNAVLSKEAFSLELTPGRQASAVPLPQVGISRCCVKCGFPTSACLAQHRKPQREEPTWRLAEKSISVCTWSSASRDHSGSPELHPPAGRGLGTERTGV